MCTFHLLLHLWCHLGFLCSSLCWLEEVSVETLPRVGGIVKATAELSFSFKPSLLAQLPSVASQPLARSARLRSLPCLPSLG